MKKIYIFLICFATILVVFGVTNTDIYTVDYWLKYAQEAGELGVPSITGGLDFSGGFVEDGTAVLYMLLYPVRFAYWIIQELALFLTYFFGGIVI